jgi:hypothetical protein
MSYSGNPANSPVDMVRFLIGDTGEPPMLTDEEIQAMLDLYGQDPFRAAVACAYSLAARYSGKADKTVGDLSLTYSSVANGYRDLASQIKGQSGIASSARAPYCGGISISEKQAVESNTDRVRPSFTKKQHDNPHAGTQDDVRGEDEPL